MTTNWQRCFGTPEKAAKTISYNCGCEVMNAVAAADPWEGCEWCPLCDGAESRCMADDEKWVLEWLESEAGE